MATLTRSNSKTSSSKPEYKEYVNFLSNYKSGGGGVQSDSGVSSSSVKSFTSLSNSTSSSSLNSDTAELSKNSCTSYTNYLESYRNRKFQPVKPNLDETTTTGSIIQNNNNNNKTVKTEIYIEIEAPNQQSSVSEVSKLFESNCINSRQYHPVGTHNNNKRNGIVKKIDIFENNDIKKKPPIKIKPDQIKLIKSSPKPSSGDVIDFVAPINSSQGLRVQSATANKSAFIVKKLNHQLIDDDAIPTPPPMLINGISKNGGLLNANIPAPPPPSQPSNNGTVKLMLNLQQPQIVSAPSLKPQISNQTSKNPSQLLNESAISPAVIVTNGESNMIPPPPPPPMPQPEIQSRPIISPAVPNNIVKGQRNGVKSDLIKSIGPQKLDKNNPMVRKLVYGTLRGMYAAHHDKANDFVATLPRNMVKKDHGIQNIIDTFASNGDLDKLNGRVNPKVEQE